MHSAYFSYQQLSVSSGEFKQKALLWANKYPVAAFYENNQIPYPYQGFENLLAVTNKTKVLVNPVEAFSGLQKAVTHTNNFLCGFLSYDLKNQIENLESLKPDYLGFPLIYFFEPEIILFLQPDGFEIQGPENEVAQIIAAIKKQKTAPAGPVSPLNIYHRTSRQQYLNTVKAIQNNILEGEVYEINYCVEFFSPEVNIDPITTFLALNQASPMPFAGYFKLQDKYLFCASPERSLKKTGDKLISQPIKGTIQRSPVPQQDEYLREQLRNSEKEISENMMIMDLVRNDLAKSSVIGSVRVEEMFGIYGFKHLYQMITTVTSTIRPDCTIADAIKNAFPMGSMTGAPKIRAMELIEKYESSRRGLFSGSIGYIKPNGDFDFNVVIRSLQYNTTNNYLSYMVGSAITFDSEPEQEYEECLLKAKAIKNILQEK